MCEIRLITCKKRFRWSFADVVFWENKKYFATFYPERIWVDVGNLTGVSFHDRTDKYIGQSMQKFREHFEIEKDILNKKLKKIKNV